MLVIGYAVTAGCGEPANPGQVACHTSTGIVLVDGQPTGGVQVMLHPGDRIGDPDALRPAGVTDGDGNFQLGTYRTDDGAPAGVYRLTLYLPETLPTGSNAPPDRLGGRYADPRTTPFEATIGTDTTRLPPIHAARDRAPRRPRQPPPIRPDLDGLN